MIPAPREEYTVLDSVKKMGKFVVVTEGCRIAGIGAEITAMVSEKAFDYLDAPIKRVGALDIPIPFAPIAENRVIPNEERITKAHKENLGVSWKERSLP